MGHGYVLDKRQMLKIDDTAEHKDWLAHCMLDDKWKRINLERPYSLPYPARILEDYMGGLAIVHKMRGLVNFTWLSHGCTESFIRKRAQKHANSMGETIAWVRHDTLSALYFEPQ